MKRSPKKQSLIRPFTYYSTRNQEHVFAPPFPAPQSAPPCKPPPAPIYVSPRGDFRTTARVIPERSGRWAWGFPRGKKGNRVNTISVRLALANNSDDPYRSYFIILHISLRELFWRGVQQPHETGGLEMKNVLTFTRGNPNGIFSDLKNGVLLSSLLEGHSCSPWCADHAAADAKRSNNQLFFFLQVHGSCARTPTSWPFQLSSRRSSQSTAPGRRSGRAPRSRSAATSRWCKCPRSRIARSLAHAPCPPPLRKIPPD